MLATACKRFPRINIFVSFLPSAASELARPTRGRSYRGADGLGERAGFEALEPGQRCAAGRGDHFAQFPGTLFRFPEHGDRAFQGLEGQAFGNRLAETRFDAPGNERFGE